MVNYSNSARLQENSYDDKWTTHFLDEKLLCTVKTEITKAKVFQSFNKLAKEVIILLGSFFETRQWVQNWLK